MDEVETIVFQGVVGFGRDVQVAVALLVAQVHLYLWESATSSQLIVAYMSH